jgi:hypothetical protein
MEESFYKTFRKTFVNQYKQKANLEHKEVKNTIVLFTPPDDPFAAIPPVPVMSFSGAHYTTKTTKSKSCQIRR